MQLIVFLASLSLIALGLFVVDRMDQADPAHRSSRRRPNSIDVRSLVSRYPG